jgi:hypothetical protein
MITFSQGFEMESSFCFANVKLIAGPATGFVDYFGLARAVQAILVWKERFDTACALEFDLEVDGRVEVVVAVKT